MTITELQAYKKILILGYAREGRATERFLKRFVPDAEILIADQASDPNYLERQKEADLVIKTPAISKRFLTVPYTTATNLFFANAHRPIIGITGSKGKSTTTALIAAILKEAGKNVHLVGNIGHAALEALCDDVPEDAIFVMELSSYQLDDIHYSPHIAVFVSFFPEHLDYHGSREEYFKAKSHITTFQTKDDLFIYHPGYPEIATLAQETKAKAIPFKIKPPFSLEGILLEGEHNIQNVLGAITVCEQMGVSLEVMERAIRNFQPLPYRLKNIGTYRGITFYDDALATAPEATIFAIQALKNVGTIFLGGTDRGYDFQALADTIQKYQIKNVVLFPDTGAKIQALLLKAGYEARFFATTSMQEAVHFAYEYTPEGSICLLSTASPSYRLWKNYEEKGDLFTKYVKEEGAK
jgi:UDP-N-acetylmuramoylalanine-D-glutamate ligase